MFDVPELLDVQVIPSEEVRIFPELPITTKILPYVTPFRVPENPDVLEIHEVPSEDVRMVQEIPTATKVIFPSVIP